MNNPDSPQNIYIDTSVLRGMSFNREVASLLAISKTGKIRLYISETTLWERGRQQYEKDCTGDRVVPFPDGLNRYLAWFKILFKEHGVNILQSNEDITNQVALHIQSDNSYFNQDNGNDRRDAHVLATAELNLDKSSLILCGDKKLALSFMNIAGFPNVRTDYKDFLLEIVGEEKNIPTLEKPSLDTLGEYLISTTLTQSFRGFINKADHRFYGWRFQVLSATDD